MQTTERHTYKELVEAWGQVANLALSTERAYGCYLVRYIMPVFGRRDVTTITVQEVDTFYASLRSTDLAPRTIRQIAAILRRSLAVGVKWGWLPFNPAAMTGPDLKGMEAHTFEAPTPDEVRALLDGCEQVYGPMLRLFVLTSAYLGTRRGETCGLRWEDVDFNAPSIQVRRSVTSQGNVKATKTGAIGTLAIPKQLETELWTAKMGDLFCGYIFHGLGRVWLPDTVTARVLAMRDRLKLPQHVTLKNLRHFHATQLLASGVDLGTVASRLRHSDKSTTLRFYSKRDEAADQRAADALEGLL